MNGEHSPSVEPSSGPVPEPGYETKDARALLLLSFGVGLIVALVVVELLMLRFYRVFLSERPKPIAERAEANIYEQLRKLHRTEDAVLSSYGWVDRNAGVVRIPIDRTIDLVAEKGTPFGKGPKTELEMNSHSGDAHASCPWCRERRRESAGKDRTEAMKMTHGPFAVVLLAASLPVSAREPAPTPRATSDIAPGLFQKVRFDQNLNATLPLDVMLRDEQGKAVTLGSYFGRRPVIVNLVYYECPMLCNEVLNSLLRSLNALEFNIGKEFEVVTVSIDPGETPALAARKKASYLKRYGRAGANQGWHFLTGDDASIRRLAGAVGFHYVYDPQSDQYAHPAGIAIATPQGRIARYYFGISYPAHDLRLSLVEAGAGKIGSPMDQILLLCFHYDPRTGKYNVAIMNVIRLLGCLTLASLGTFMFVMFRRDRREKAQLEF